MQRADEERSIVDRLRSGIAVSDARFDRLLGPQLRAASEVHFTPVAVAVRAATWLAGGGATEIVDIGSGVGKFCLIGAATTEARFIGIEAREGLVHASRQLAHRLGLVRAEFVHGDARRLTFERFQAFYIFNPFAEAGADPEEWLDSRPPTAELASDVAWLRRALAAAPEGTRVAVYCGFGGAMPPGYRLVAAEDMRARGMLELWVRRNT